MRCVRRVERQGGRRQKKLARRRKKMEESGQKRKKMEKPGKNWQIFFNAEKWKFFVFSRGKKSFLIGKSGFQIKKIASGGGIFESRLSLFFFPRIQLEKTGKNWQSGRSRSTRRRTFATWARRESWESVFRETYNPLIATFVHFSLKYTRGPREFQHFFGQVGQETIFEKHAE